MLIDGAATDPLLMAIDRHLQRWALSVPHLPGAPPRVPCNALRLPPLPERDVVTTDQAMLSALPRWQRFVRLWYLSDLSLERVGVRLEMSRTRLLDERRVVLAYFLGRLSKVGIPLPSLEES